MEPVAGAGCSGTCDWDPVVESRPIGSEPSCQRSSLEPGTYAARLRDSSRPGAAAFVAVDGGDLRVLGDEDTAGIAMGQCQVKHSLRF